MMIPSPRAVIELDPTDLVAAARVIEVAMQTGLCSSLLAGAATSGQHAARCNLDAQATGAILDVLVNLKFADCEIPLYSGSTYLADLAQFTPGGLRGAATLWEGLLAFATSGRLAGGAERSNASREAKYTEVAKDLWRLFEAPAKRLAAILALKPRRILDIGAGSGVWGLTLAQASLDAHVTALDFPSVLNHFEASAATLGMEHRVTCIPGDYHSCDFPAKAFDVVVLANVLHLEAPALAKALLSRAAQAVAHGGRLVVVDILPDDEPVWRLSSAIYSLSLAMRTGAPGPHSRSQLEMWLRDDGLRDVKFLRLGTRRPLLGAMLGTVESSQIIRR